MPTVILPRVYELSASQVITKARRVLQDESNPYRWGDLELLGWLNDAVASMVGIVPSLFFAQAPHTCSAGYRQTVVNARASAVVEVIGVPEANHAVLTRFMPGWQSGVPGPIQNWMRVEDDPLAFYCYPPAVDGAPLPILIIERPLPIDAIEDAVPVPEHYEPALVDYVVAMAQAKDDESIDMSRMQTFQANFAARVKGD